MRHEFSARMTKFRSVRHKLQMTVIFFITLLAVFMYYYFPSQQKQALEESFRRQVQSLAQSVALGYTLAQRYEDYTGLKAAIDHARSDNSLRFVAVVSGGLTLFSYPEGFTFSEDMMHIDTLVVSRAPINPDGQVEVVVGNSRKPIEEQLRTIRHTTMLVSLATLLLGSFFAFGQAGMIVRPLAALKRSMARVEQGDLDVTVHVARRDEIGELAIEFQHMIESVRTARDHVEKANKELLEKNEALNVSEQNFRLIFDSAPVPLALTRVEDSVPILINDAMLVLLELTEEQAMKMRAADVYAKKEERDMILGYLASKTPINDVEIQILTGRKNVKSVSMSISPMNYHGESCLEVRLVDITQRKQDEEKILHKNIELTKANEEILRQKEVLDSQAKDIQHANSELLRRNIQIQADREKLSVALENLKATQAQLIQSEKLAALGTLVAGIAHEINTPLGAIRASIGNIERALGRAISQLPELFRLLSPSEQTEFFSLLNTALETTPRLSAKELRQKRRGIAAELEAAGVPHAEELAEDLAEMGLLEGPMQWEVLLRHHHAQFVMQLAHRLVLQQRNSQNIAVAVEKAAKVVFALKNYARFDQSGKKCPALITEGIETVLTLYHNQLKQATEVIRKFDPVPEIMCYPDELNQVWTNLIHNAMQAMNNAGTLEIAVAKENSDIVVRVTDSGQGIPPEIKERIFEPFFTTKTAGEGSGLGLDIVRKIIERHEGTIAVESVPGKTTFTVRIPIILPSPAPETEQAHLAQQ